MVEGEWGEKRSRRKGEGRHCKGNLPDNSRSKRSYTLERAFHRSGYSVDGSLTSVSVVPQRRYYGGSTAKVISGRISINPQIKVIFISVNKNQKKKIQDQGLSGYSAAPLTSSAPLRLGKCRLSWVGLGYAFRPSGAAATDTPHLASSRYRLARLRADRTLPVHLCLILLETSFVVVVRLFFVCFFN